MAVTSNVDYSFLQCILTQYLWRQYWVRQLLWRSACRVHGVIWRVGAARRRQTLPYWKRNSECLHGQAFVLYVISCITSPSYGRCFLLSSVCFHVLLHPLKEGEAARSLITRSINYASKPTTQAEQNCTHCVDASFVLYNKNLDFLCEFGEIWRKWGASQKRVHRMPNLSRKFWM